MFSSIFIYLYVLFSYLSSSFGLELSECGFGLESMWFLFQRCQRHMVERYLLVSIVIFLCSTIALCFFFFLFTTDIARSEHVRWIVQSSYTIMFYVLKSGLRQVIFADFAIDYLKRCAGESSRLRDILHRARILPSLSCLHEICE